MNVMKAGITLPLVAVFLLLTIASCGNEDPLAPGGATMTISANPLSIPADGASTTQIEVVMMDSSGSALNGNVVFFTTTLGSITPQATVDNGIARTTLTAGTNEGTATVTAISGSLSDTIQVTIGFQNVSIFLTANPPEIPADGISTSTIEAFVTEDKGIVPDGTDVAFTTTLGTITPNAQTVSGRATATLTAGVKEETATVTAIVRSTSQTTDVTIGIPVSNITLTVNPTEFEVETADAQTHVASVIATVWDAAGNPIDNKPVIITSDKGSLDSAGSVRKTDEFGQVTDTFRITIAVPQGTSQSVRLTATSGSISATATITIINKG